MSTLSYGPFLGKLIDRKDMIQNRNSEKGYRDVVLNISGNAAANVACSTSNLVIPCRIASAFSLSQQAFPNSQFEIGLAAMYVP